MSVSKTLPVTRAQINSMEHAGSVIPGTVYIVDGRAVKIGASPFLAIEIGAAPDAVDWNTLEGRPPFVAAGEDAADARALLELGSAAQSDNGAFATAEQGGRADTAIQQIKTVNGENLVGSGNLVLGASNVLKSFQSGSVNIPAASTSVNVTIAAVVASKCAVTLTLLSSASDVTATSINLASTQLTITRSGGGNLRYFWTITEYN